MHAASVDLRLKKHFKFAQCMCLHFYGAVAMRITLFIVMTIKERTVERCPQDKLKKIEIHTMGIFAKVNSTYLWK